MLCCCVCDRQQRELADVELSRLSAEVEASAAAAADAQGQLAAAAAEAAKQTETARSAQLKVGAHNRPALCWCLHAVSCLQQLICVFHVESHACRT
jgi:hypothetical protein